MHQIEDASGCVIVLSHDEKHFLDTVAAGMWSGPAPKLDINTIDCMGLIGKAGYCIADKRYNLAEKLLTAAELKASSAVDLHFCYNEWIKVLYKQREDKGHLIQCIEYCKKDIYLYPCFCEQWMQIEFEKLNEHYKQLKFLYKKGEYNIEREKIISRGVDVGMPSFTRLAIIYEKSGMIQDAIQVCELAIKYRLSDATKGGFDARLEKLKEAITCL
jgi:tetratricopeptide (TPR) repeat protein